MFKKIIGLGSKKGPGRRDTSLSTSTTHASDSRRSLPTSSPSAIGSNREQLQGSSPDSGPLGLNVIYTPDNGRKADIVFIHGLGGTSRWTWSKDRDPELFWPLTFLPLEPDLCLARILTFGYDASVQKTGGLTTSVLDFAKDLLFDLKYGRDQNSDDLAMGNVPIIFVVHSMGGLIVKEAYMQGQHDPEYETIIKAVTAITFIATPHRGTNLAQTLNRILDSAIVTNSKQYVADLVKNSVTIQKLNEQFRHIAPRLQIVSFYETLPTSIGLRNVRVMVLEKESSVLGYPGEVSKALAADHHGVCKYHGLDDPNYITMRNILKSLVSKILSKENTAKPIVSTRRTSQALRAFLSLPVLPSADYIFFRDRWSQGTNSWIEHDNDFQEWRDPQRHDGHLPWLSGDAATGKSVLASFIVNSLVERGMRCSYFFIRYGDRLKRTISVLLRSLAFQMAQSMPMVMERMADLMDEALDLENVDFKVIWDRIFRSLIFKCVGSEPIYWVIDGLDESEDPRALARLLTDMPPDLPLRILVTARRSSEILSVLSKPAKNSKLGIVTVEGHLEDLHQYLRSELRVSGSAELRTDIERRIIEGSNNNFLWVCLAVDKVNRCHTYKEIDSALIDFPTGMEAIYDRMAKSIVEQPNEGDRTLATRIVQCTSCSLRALSIDELSQALGDIALDILDVPKAILDLCGGFVVVDNDGKVSMVHQTAREYLFDTTKTDRPFSVNRSDAHQQMFQNSIRCLMSNNLRMALSRGQKPSFVEYAAESWSSHLAHTRRDEMDCITTLKRFLTGRWALVWIHALALSKRLRAMLLTSKNLAQYASKRTHSDTSPGILEQELFENWAVDMLRIPGKFGDVLHRKPDSIYSLIPPFCPKSSPIYQQFGKRDGLSIYGLSAEKWDDSLARMSFGASFSTAIQASGALIAILVASGKTLLYDPSDFREWSVSPLEHGERLLSMQLNSSATLLATYGNRTVKIWQVSSGECIQSCEIHGSKARPLALRFSPDNSKLVIGSEDRCIRSLDLSYTHPVWSVIAELEEEEIAGQFTNSASHIALNHDSTMAAVAYRRYPVSAWDLDGPMHIGLCRRKDQGAVIREVRDLTWHPHLPVVFGVNLEGTVFKWAPYDDVVDEVLGTANKLCISNDGELLATGDSYGRIALYTSSHLNLLYQLASQDSVFQLTFSPDSRRLYDVRGYHANAWEPSALAKFKAQSKTSVDASSEYGASLSTDVSLVTCAVVDPITALVKCPNGPLFCSGSSRGVVTLHDTRRGKLGTLYVSRAKFTVNQIAWNNDQKQLCFTDSSKDIVFMAIDTTKPGRDIRQRASVSMRKFSKESISQLLFKADSQLLLVTSNSRAHTISLDDYALKTTVELKDTEKRKWLLHPDNAKLILGLGVQSICIFDWDLNEDVKLIYSYSNEPSGDNSVDMNSYSVDKVITSYDKKHILLQMVHLNREIAWGGERFELPQDTPRAIER
ncbi:hypothetical protein F5Y15DRAFT_95240 [Xylariaceae sp. FL0016]|nr:hypothetical protein F5Y15DRAFT_95240 [Xylariaceae sp. FL0016]